MSLLTLLVIVIIICLVVWLLRSNPLPQPWNWVITAAAVLFLIVWLLSISGLPPGLRLH